MLKAKGDDRTYLHTRYGRVGEDGVQTLVPMPRGAAEQAYAKTFKQKTAASKGYTPIEMKLGAGDKACVKAEVKSGAAPEAKHAGSKLPASVQDFVQLIFDKDLMEQSVTQVGYDVKKLPLGQLSEETVKNGYAYLR